MPQFKKTILYPTFQASRPGYLQYAIWGGSRPRKCVFSGITVGVTSTINAAAEVVKAIAAAEGLQSVREMEFYDLLTYRGYHGHDAGVFQFVRLRLSLNRGQITEVDHDWMVRCPEDVIATFREVIGEEGDEVIQAAGSVSHRQRISVSVPMPEFRA